MRLYAALLDGAEQVTHTLSTGRAAYLQVARGKLSLNGQALQQGDGVRVNAEAELKLHDATQAEVLLFDLP